jgi:PD-(D/E)XK nuclease superfamily
MLRISGNILSELPENLTNDLRNSLLEGSVERVTQLLSQILLAHSSVYMTKAIEAVYQAFLFGYLLGQWSLDGKNWMVTVESEAGHGRLDLSIIQFSANRGVVIETKHSSSEENLESSANMGLNQALDREYAEALKRRHCLEYVHVFGIAFHKKKCYVVKRDQPI